MAKVGFKRSLLIVASWTEAKLSILEVMKIDCHISFNVFIWPVRMAKSKHNNSLCNLILAKILFGYTFLDTVLDVRLSLQYHSNLSCP